MIPEDYDPEADDPDYERRLAAMTQRGESLYDFPVSYQWRQHEARYCEGIELPDLEPYPLPLTKGEGEQRGSRPSNAHIEAMKQRILTKSLQ